MAGANGHGSAGGWRRWSLARGIGVALAVLVAGLIFTMLLTQGARTTAETEARREFEFACNEIQMRIHDRLAAQAQLLSSGAALFDSSGEVTREEWKTFAGRLRADGALSGIQGLGFSKVIAAEDLAQHIEQIQAEGFVTYTVQPEGEREVYSSIIYLEPFEGRNLRAFGYDMYSEPVRQAAMARARDENVATLSGKVMLVQETEEDVQAGTLMYVPVYEKGMPNDTVEERRAALAGWVYSPYRMNDLLNNIAGSWASREGKEIHLAVYDGDVIGSDQLLYDSRGAVGEAAPAKAQLSMATPVDFAGKRWTVYCAQVGDLAATPGFARVWIVLGGGAMISLLMFGLVLSLASMRFRAQQMAEQLTADLRASEEKYRTVALFTYDWEAWRAPGGQYVYVSPSCERITGHTVAEFMADPELVVQIAHADDRAGVAEYYRAVMEDARARNAELDFRIVTTTGETRWISHSSTPVYGEDGQWLGRRESYRDSTERKRREEEVRERSAELAVAVAELERAAKIKDEFLAAVSHELRTPLMGVLSMAEVLELQVGGQLSERQTRYVHAIRENGERLLTLINSLLRYTDLVAGRVQMTADLCVLADVCRGAANSVRARAEQKGLAVEVGVEPPDATVVCSSLGVMQVLEQLLDNAVKFTPAGGRIGVEAVREVDGGSGRATVRLVVWDTGIGIAAEQVQKIFLPFTQADGSLARRYEGVGLGLAFVQRMVDLLGGTIAVESVVGEGSRFTVTLQDTGRADQVSG